MNDIESGTQVFVIRVWVEVGTGGVPVWRGHVTHVMSGTRRYLTSLTQITAFIAPYMEAMGIREDE